MPRSLLRTTAACAVLLLTVAGCSSGAQEQPAEGDATASGQFPVTLEHAFGSTTVPEQPQRVVTVGFNDADFALAVGVQPVGVRENLGAYDYEQRPWAQEALSRGPAPQLLTGTEIPIEQVAALQPDLILGVYSFMNKATYDALSQIAPTVAQATEDGTNPASWDEQTRITGQATGRTAEAEQVIADTQATFDEARRTHPEFDGKTLKLGFYIQGTPYDMGTDDLRAQLFGGLGFEVRPDSQPLSLEEQGRLDADVLTVLGRPRAEAEADPVFRAVPAVEQGRVVYLGAFETEFAAALGYSSPLSLPYAVDDVAPKLAEAIAGNAPGN
ncbi:MULTISPECIES: iron-siderophore ABC transporter substrate-binding protein [Pseudonocardia]|uniref:Fe(3+)-citrate-binding protein YfmC n=2 Tax=Pseudonocardia TaxID=1847 RepID=A0A1Y2N2Z7_PSEAH|nr:MULTISPECIES: ABC transporter substrate-binding protein [Pseudonocardia]OSY41844.1 Fe(3+)-citrate-binding protein YfmC precursor [Pseudonocardia autotrophica]TDN71104.1 iron complex transport system substrate-binding protein [Pseudonocardia autotrophica]BBG01774.1 ABC transporter substrate-binding protein [Pseudonocardia autotrophica]GEC26277.1 ABC transporter substrate-binding protein [Pseudonocardia saturnea]